VRVEIHRYDPETKRQWVDSYEVPIEGRSMTVMDVLEDIASSQDSTLAYYRHSACNHGICARCLVSVNGRPRLACTEIVTDYESLALAPIANRRLIRDLITR
jgi:succinate dehydrogenase / fumarate reductase iron-sulfur subunit